uniref:Uncharacterized protein n=1 Tax=Romanomermis culicivorax TaxID=13658 RepID=A0A915I343_ROMCU
MEAWKEKMTKFERFKFCKSTSKPALIAFLAALIAIGPCGKISRAISKLLTKAPSSLISFRLSIR